MTGLASGAQGGIGNATLNRMLATRNATVPANNRIAVFGPSHAANHFTQATDSPGRFALPSGSAQGPVNWANFLSGGRAVLETRDGFGWFGDWTGPQTWNGTAYPGMLSRLADVIAGGAGHVVLVAPSANDRNAWSAAQSLAALTTIIDTLTARGRLVTVLLDYPHGDATVTGYLLANTAASPQLDHWHRLNRALWARHGSGGVRVIDTPALIADAAAANGQATAGMLIDGLHLTQLAAFTIGRVLAREWRRLYPQIGGLPFGNGEVANQAGVNDVALQSANPYFAGTGGTPGTGGSGTIGDGWSASLSAGVTAAYSKVTTSAFAGAAYADQDGRLTKDWQQIALSGTATGNGEVMVLRRAVACTAGDTVRAAAEIEIDQGLTGVSGVSLFCWQSAGNPPAYRQARAMAAPTALAGSPWPGYAMTGVMRTPAWTNESAQYNVTLVVRPITGQAISGTIRVRGLGAGKALV